jgi:hypothetical protein
VKNNYRSLINDHLPSDSQQDSWACRPYFCVNVVEVGLRVGMNVDRKSLSDLACPLADLLCGRCQTMLFVASESWASWKLPKMVSSIERGQKESWERGTSGNREFRSPSYESYLLVLPTFIIFYRIYYPLPTSL